MNITDDILEEITIYGRMHITPKRICIMMDLNGEDESQLLKLFNDPESEVSRAYEKGKIKKDVEIMESLEAYISSGGENSGEAAKALGEIRKRQELNELRKDLFNV